MSKMKYILFACKPGKNYDTDEDDYRCFWNETYDSRELAERWMKNRKSKLKDDEFMYIGEREDCGCEDYYNCCDCGNQDGDGCGCAYCWSCNACEDCLNGD